MAVCSRSRVPGSARSDHDAHSRALPWSPQAVARTVQSAHGEAAQQAPKPTLLRHEALLASRVPRTQRAGRGSDSDAALAGYSPPLGTPSGVSGRSLSLASPDGTPTLARQLTASSTDTHVAASQQFSSSGRSLLRGSARTASSRAPRPVQPPFRVSV